MSTQPKPKALFRAVLFQNQLLYETKPSSCQQNFVGVNKSLLTSTKVLPTPSKDVLSSTKVLLMPSKDLLTSTQSLLSSTQVLLTSTQSLLAPTKSLLTSTQVLLTPTPIVLTATRNLLTSTENAFGCNRIRVGRSVIRWPEHRLRQSNASPGGYAAPSPR